MARSVIVPVLAASRHTSAACRVRLKVPFRCTAITSSNSCSLMDTSIRSRRMPALLTTTWRSPNAETAWSTIAFAPSNELTLSVLATAWPPAAVISSTTDCAAEMSAPEPSTAPPRSLTTTLAPREANKRACSRPIPRPAPVMIATLSCSIVQPSSRIRRGPAAGGRWSERDDCNGAAACQTDATTSPSAGGFEQAALQVAALGIGPRQVEGPAVRLGGLGTTGQATQHVSARRGEEAVGAQLTVRRDAVEQQQARLGPLAHGDGDGAVERDDRRGREREQV